MSTEVLMSYQNIIAVANQHMDKFATEIVEDKKTNVVSEDFVKEMHEYLGAKVKANNEIIYEIDKEILSRVKKSLPGATLGNIMTSVFKRYEKELERMKELNKKPSRPKPDLTVKR